jgi:hypothetical protein
MRRPFGACINIRSDEVGWAVSSNVPVGLASRSGLIGCVVYVVWRGSQPHWRCGGVGGAVLVFFFGGSLLFFLVLYCHAPVGEGSGSVFREPSSLPCGLEGDI